jgi:hypothetical protein
MVYCKYTNHNYSGIGGVDVNVDNDKIAYRCLFSKLYIIQIKLEAVNGTNKEIEVPFTKHKEHGILMIWI